MCHPITRSPALSPKDHAKTEQVQSQPFPGHLDAQEEPAALLPLTFVSATDGIHTLPLNTEEAGIWSTCVWLLWFFMKVSASLTDSSLSSLLHVTPKSITRRGSPMHCCLSLLCTFIRHFIYHLWGGHSRTSTYEDGWDSLQGSVIPSKHFKSQDWARWGDRKDFWAQGTHHEEGLPGGEESWQSPRRYNEDPEEGQLTQREGVRKGNQKVAPKLSLKRVFQGFPGGPVVRDPPASAGDSGLIPGVGRFHMPQGN